MASIMENGIFNFSKGDLSDAAKIGQIDDMVIWVWENDPCGNVPCIHIVDEKTGGNKLNGIKKKRLRGNHYPQLQENKRSGPNKRGSPGCIQRMGNTYTLQ